MIGKKLCKDDYVEIEKLHKIIVQNVKQLECPIFLTPVNAIRVGKDDLKLHQQDGIKYYFYDNESLTKGLQEFFEDEYVRSVLARKAYVYDEGEIFEEVYPASKALGLSKFKRSYIKTNLMKICFKVMPWGTLDGNTQMPLHVESVVLIPE